MYLFEATSGYAFLGPRCHGAGTDTAHVAVAASWSSRAPATILLSLDDGDPHPPVWRIARSLLAAGMSSGEWVGQGDVQLRAPGAFVTLHFRPPGQFPVHLVVRREPFDRLVLAAELEVPDGGPAEQELIEAALDAEFRSRGLA